MFMIETLMERLVMINLSANYLQKNRVESDLIYLLYCISFEKKFK